MQDPSSGFPGSTAVLAVAGLVALIAGLAVLMRGAGARGRRAAIAVLAVGGAGLFLGGTAFAAPLSIRAAGEASIAAVPATTTSPTPTSTPSAPLLASVALAELTVKGPSPMTGYQRVADFGKAWTDVDGNDCDTRDDVLRRDLQNVKGAPCKVRSGILHDPYTGDTITFTRGVTTSEAVQIDHVVPLADAWRTGAQKLTRTERVALANDPVNLFAVDGPTNIRKGDGDAATWLPPRKAFRCTYVAHQIAVKRTYRLWVTKAERAAMQRILVRCPDQTLPVEAVVVPTDEVVHPGGLCAEIGAVGHTAKGTAMRCRVTSTDDRARWRRA